MGTRRDGRGQIGTPRQRCEDTEEQGRRDSEEDRETRSQEDEEGETQAKSYKERQTDTRAETDRQTDRHRDAQTQEARTRQTAPPTTGPRTGRLPLACLLSSVRGGVPRCRLGTAEAGVTQWAN